MNNRFHINSYASDDDDFGIKTVHSHKMEEKQSKKKQINQRDIGDDMEMYGHGKANQRSNVRTIENEVYDENDRRNANARSKHQTVNENNNAINNKKHKRGRSASDDDDQDDEDFNPAHMEPQHKEKKQRQVNYDDNAVSLHEFEELKQRYETLLQLRFTDAEKNLEKLIQSSNTKMELERERRRELEQKVSDLQNQLSIQQKKAATSSNINANETSSKSMGDNSSVDELRRLQEENESLGSEIDRMSEVIKAYAEITGLQIFHNIHPNTNMSTIDCVSVNMQQKKAFKFQLVESATSTNSFKYSPIGNATHLPFDLRTEKPVLKDSLPLLISRITQSMHTSQ